MLPQHLLLLTLLGVARAQDGEAPDPAQSEDEADGEGEGDGTVPQDPHATVPTLDPTPAATPPEDAPAKPVVSPTAANLTVAAPPPAVPATAAAPATSATQAPASAPSGTPSGWKQQGGQDLAVPEDLIYQGWYGSVSLLGGAALAGGVSYVADTGLGMDLSAGVRLGLASQLEANLVGTAGLFYVAGRRTRHGLFGRGGATLPGVGWTEAFAAGGYAVRVHGSRGLWMGADLGLGAMIIQDVPTSPDPWPLIAYARWTMDIPTQRAQREH